MPSSSPSGFSEVATQEVLEDYAQTFFNRPNDFIAMRSMPVRRSAKQSALYTEFDVDDWKSSFFKPRKGGTESAGAKFTTSKEPYFCRPWAGHKDLTEDDLINADEGIRLRRSAVNLVSNSGMLKIEELFNDSFIKTGVWGHDDTTRNWTTANSTPLQDIADGSKRIEDASNQTPDSAIVTLGAYNILRYNQQLLTRVGYNSGATTVNPADVDAASLASAFGLRRVNVLRRSGTNATLGNHMLLYKAPDNPDYEDPTAGMIFVWDRGGVGDMGMRFRTIQSEMTLSERIEGDLAVDMKVTGNTLGVFYENVGA